MKRILVLFALFAAAAGYAQTVEKQTFVYAVKQTDTLRLDRYVALTPDSRTKPCLMFVFGGGFVVGMKKAMQAGTLSEETFPEAWITTLAMATGDLYDATAYVCDHASAWGVDKTRIVASGSSAGAITVLMGEYGICNGHPLARQKLPQDFNYAGVISYAGAIFNTQEELRWAKTPAPMMLFHGDADRNVPYDAVLYDGNGFFGSKHIADMLTERRIPHWFYSVANTNHVMATRPMYDNRYEIDAFLEKLVLKREPLVIDTYVTPLEAPELPKAFTLSDYIDANYGK